jgi:hypothetical protein
MTPNASAVSSSPSPMQTPTLTGPELDATKFALVIAPDLTREAEVADFLTRVADGTPWAFTPMPIATVVPIATPLLGINNACAQGGGPLNLGNCWTGLANSNYLFVSTATQRADPEQGLVEVYTTTLDRLTYGISQWYPTPNRVGLIYITDVNWPVLTLTTENSPPDTFAFNVDTRQWVSPSPEPSVTMPTTPLFSPLPSPSP